MQNVRRRRKNALKPTWSADLQRNGLPPGTVFSRGTGALQYDSDGLVKWGPENLITYSEQLDNAAWTASGASVSANAAAAPNGATVADNLVESAALTVHRIYSNTFAQVGKTGYRTAVYAKAAGRNTFRLENAGGAGTFGATFNLSNGATSNIDANTTATCTSVGNSWYLCEITFTWPSSGNTNVWLNLQNPAGTSSYTGDGTSGIYFYGVMTHRTPNVSSAYWPTTSAAYYGPRFGYDPTTLSPIGLMVEPYSQNTVQYSEALTNVAWTAQNVTVTDNAITAPNGLTTASTVKESSSTSVHEIECAVSVTSGKDYNVSCFVKNISGTRWVNFGISGGAFFFFRPSDGTIGSSLLMSDIVAVSLPNGWYRISGRYTAASTVSTSCRLYMSATDTGAGGPSYAGDNTSTIGVWGVEVKAGTSEFGVGYSSYIPTYGASGARNADIAYVPTTNIPGFSAATGMTLAANARLESIGANGTNGVVAINDGSDTDFAGIQMSYGGGIGRDEFWRSSAQTRPQRVLAITYRTDRRMSLGFSTSTAMSALNGAIDASVSYTGSYTLPTGATRLYLGACAAIGTTAQLNGSVKSVSYYKGNPSYNFIRQVSSK